MDHELNTAALLQQAHPWHGVDPRVSGASLRVYIENTQFTLMKYESDPETGLLQIDQPLDTSSLPPSAYGFVPKTLCGAAVAQLTSRRRGDRAPLDVFVLSERPIPAPGVLAEVRIVGGIPVRDETFADDKLVAVLHRDAQLGHIDDIGDVPIYLIERLCHFLAHAPVDGSSEVGDPFGRSRAEALLNAALQDYAQTYG